MFFTKNPSQTLSGKREDQKRANIFHDGPVDRVWENLGLGASRSRAAGGLGHPAQNSERVLRRFLLVFMCSDL